MGPEVGARVEAGLQFVRTVAFEAADVVKRGLVHAVESARRFPEVQREAMQMIDGSYAVFNPNSPNALSHIGTTPGRVEEQSYGRDTIQ